MPLSPGEKELIAEGLAKLSGKELYDLKEPLVRLLNNLNRVNSAYPETQKFLAARRLTSVSQLDSDGKKELTQHLTNVLRSIAS